MSIMFCHVPQILLFQVFRDPILMKAKSGSGNGSSASRLLRRCPNHGQQKNVSDHKNKIGLKKRTLRNHRTIKYKMFSAFELAVSSHATSFNRSKSLNFKSLNSRVAENSFWGSGPWRGGWVFASWLKSWSSIKFVLFSNFGKQEEVEKMWAKNKFTFSKTSS